VHLQLEQTKTTKCIGALAKILTKTTKCTGAFSMFMQISGEYINALGGICEKTVHCIDA